MTLGAAGLREALTAAGLEPVGVDDADAVSLVTGYGPDVVWRDVMRAAVRVRDGLPWVASNTDGTIPTAFGIAPGHGVMVRMLSDFTDVSPVVAGKPERPLFDETIARTGARRPLMVGDRLDTDIEGATHAGIDSLLVMTGVTGLPDLVAAAPRLRPTYLAADLRGLLAPHAAPTVDGQDVGGGGLDGHGRRRPAHDRRDGRPERLVALRRGGGLVGAGRLGDRRRRQRRAPTGSGTGDGYAPRMSETGAEQTGVPAVDEALTALEGLEERPVDEHPAVFESVHGALRSVLNGDQGA